MSCRFAKAPLTAGSVWLIMGIENWMTSDHDQTLIGDPERHDPFAHIAMLKAHAGPIAKLVSINAFHVRSDGTMNLNAGHLPRSQVVSEFVVALAERPKNGPPPGVAGPAGEPWIQAIRLTASRPGACVEWSSVGASRRTSAFTVTEG